MGVGASQQEGFLAKAAGNKRSASHCNSSVGGRTGHNKHEHILPHGNPRIQLLHHFAATLTLEESVNNAFGNYRADNCTQDLEITLAPAKASFITIRRNTLPLIAPYA